MHVYFVSYLLSVVADVARGKRSLLEYSREYGISILNWKLIYLAHAFYKAELMQVIGMFQTLEHGKRDDCTRPYLH